MTTPVVIVLNGVIVAVTEDRPRILTVKHPDNSLKVSEEADFGDGAPPDALPFGPLDPVADRTLELGLRGWVREQTGIELGYVEQLYTFGDRNREPGVRQGGPRVISIPYLALVREEQLSVRGEANWRDWYEYFPWEDWLWKRPSMIDFGNRPSSGPVGSSSCRCDDSQPPAGKDRDRLRSGRSSLGPGASVGTL